MKALLDTNIIVHREANRVINRDIGVLFRWLDRLRYTKCVHPASVAEINKLNNPATRESLNIKLESYSVLQVQSPLDTTVEALSARVDRNENDRVDTLLINELFNGRVDVLITEDRKARSKAAVLGLGDRVFRIEEFLEKVTAENPALADYKVLSVKKDLFGTVDVADPFFDSLREDYEGFDRWFNGKSEEEAYVCRNTDGVAAFLYLKLEGVDEPYYGLDPPFTPQRRLKIGTLKVELNGYRLGERFLKIVFDNALRQRVEEVYVTTFEDRIEQQRLIRLLEEFGFVRHGTKGTRVRRELVYVRDMRKAFDSDHPRLTYPYFGRSARAFLVPIYPEYHTNLFPDSILRTESPLDYVENEPFRNAISKVYICRSRFRDLHKGDVIIFYRTGGYYEGVVSTIGIVESTVQGIATAEQFLSACRKRSVFSDAELLKHWNFNSGNRPFVVNFLYAYSFPKRLNLAKLIEMGVIRDSSSVPRGFEQISQEAFEAILKETKTDAGIIVD